MSHSVIIQFAVGTDIHRLRNLGEALYRSLPAIDGQISIEQIGTSKDRLEVIGIHSRKLKRVVAHARTLLAQHGLRAEVSTHGHVPGRGAGGH